MIEQRYQAAAGSGEFWAYRARRSDEVVQVEVTVFSSKSAPGAGRDYAR